MNDLLQSTAIRLPLKAYLASDHVSAATGKTIAIVISKNGSAFANPSGGATNATSIGNGWYYVDLSATDTGTLGPLVVRGTEGTIDDVEQEYQVVGAAGDTAGTTTLLGRLTDTRAANLDDLDVAVSSRSTYAGADTAGTTTLLSRLTAGRATGLDFLDAAISSRSTYAGADTAGTTTLLGRLTGPRATNLDFLDVAVSSRSTYAGGAVALSAAGVDAVQVEPGLNLRQAMSIAVAALAGTSSGVSTGAPIYHGAGVATTRITATSSDGDRSVVTLNPPA